MMNNEFVPYQQSLELKELGFDEPCLKIGNTHGHVMWKFIECEENAVDIKDILFNTKFDKEHFTDIPTFSQVFRWFREKCVFYINMVDSDLFYFVVHLKKGMIKNPEEILMSDHFKTYEEAELACLKKLIEFVKEETK